MYMYCTCACVCEHVHVDVCTCTCMLNVYSVRLCALHCVFIILYVCISSGLVHKLLELVGSQKVVDQVPARKE